MARFVVVVLLPITLVVPFFGQNQPVSDPQALSLAAQGITALTGGSTISDVSLTGTAVRHSDGQNQTGTVTLLAKGSGESRMDLSIAGSVTTQLRNDNSGVPQGATSTDNGTQQQWAFHNCWINASWFFPALSLLANTSDPTVIWKYIGSETRNGTSVQHLQVFRYIANGKPQTIALTQMVSTMDIFLDSTSSLPVALAFNRHPDNDATTNISVEVDFSSYQSFGGSMVPTHFQELISGETSLDITIGSALFNSGLSDDLFAISGS